MNRNSKVGVMVLMALVAGAGVFSAGCTVASRTALPELPAIPVLTITTTTVPTPAFTNTPYVPPGGPGATLTTAGGTGAITNCTAVAGSFTPAMGFVGPAPTTFLPPGLTLTAVGSTCVLGGTVAAGAPLGFYRFTVRAQDSSGIADTQDYTLEVRVGFILNGFTVGNPKVGTPFGVMGAGLTLPTTGGTVAGDLASCTASANLPAGLVFGVDNTLPSPRRNCRLSGTPTMAGTFMNVMFTATDQGTAGSNTFTIASIIVNDTLNITTMMLPNGAVNAAYNQIVDRSGGQTPFLFSITAGDFTPMGSTFVGNAGTSCQGLALDGASMAANTTISGAAALAGVCGTGGAGTFTVQVMDTATSSTTTAGTFVTTAATTDPQALSITVDKTDTTTTITSDMPDPSVADQAYTVNVQVQANTAGATLPTGDVTVTDGTGAMCTATLTPGNPSTGSCMITSTTAGLKTLTASYPSDANFNASMDTEDHTVNTRATTTVVVLAPSTVSVNQASMVTVTVTDVEPAGTASSPAGTIVITSLDAGNPSTDMITACTLAATGPGVSTCTAMLTPADLGSGMRSVTAAYTANDSKHTDSDSTGAPQTLIVTARTTSTMVMLSAASTFVDQSINVTVTVTDTDPTGTPSAPDGTIAIMSGDGTDVIGMCTLALMTPTATQSQCTTTLTPTQLGGGMRSITASYTATDMDHANSNSNLTPQILTVMARTTTTMVMLAPASVLVSEDSMATVTVTDTAAGTQSAPLGTVSFAGEAGDGFSGGGSCMLVAATMNSSTCTLTVTPSLLGDGTHTIMATYTPANNGLAAQDHDTSNGTADLTVTARPTTTVVMLAPSSVLVNEDSTVTVTVSDVGGTGTPSAPGGTIMIMSGDGTDVIGVCTLTLGTPTATESQCSTTLTPTQVGTGTRSVTATYVATDMVHADSDSTAAPQVLTVSPRPTTTMITLLPTTVLVNEASMATVTVTDIGATGAGSPPVGMIAFMGEAGDMFGMCTLAPATATSSTCTASVTPTLLGDGLHTITATFLATMVHDTSNSSADLTVTLRTTMTSVLIALPTVFVNEADTITITVVDTSAGGTPTAPSGMATLMSNDPSDVLSGGGMCALVAMSMTTSACDVTVTPTQLGSSSRTVTATYPGSMVHSGSMSGGADTFLVAPRPTSTAVNFSNPTPAIAEPVMVTAFVTDDSGAGTAVTPMGMVMFLSSDGGDVFVPVSAACMLVETVPGQSSCTVTVTASTAGMRDVMGTYAPANAGMAAQIHDTSNGSDTLDVQLRDTMTAVAFSDDPVFVDQMNNVFVTVTDIDNGTQSPPMGIVAVISDDLTDTIVGVCTLVPDMTGNSSSCTVTVEPNQVGAGFRMITADFPSNALHNASSGSNSFGVNPRTTTTAVSFSNATPFVNETAMVTATVTDSSGVGTASTPVGMVSFNSSDGADVFSAMSCTLAETVPGQASCTVMVTASTAGARGIMGTYNPANAGMAAQVHETSNDTQTLDAQLRPTTTMVALADGTTFVNEVEMVTVTVTDVAGAGAAITPTGMVTVSSDQAGAFSNPGASCTLVETVLGTASCTVDYTPAAVAGGTHNITAMFTATTVHDASDNGAGEPLTVTPRATTTMVMLASASVIVQEETTATVTVTDDPANPGSPLAPNSASTVMIMSDDGTDVLGSCTLVVGSPTPSQSECTATIRPTQVGTGTRSITASYTAGDDVHSDSDSTATPQLLTVNPRPTTTMVTLSTTTAATGQMFTATATVTDSSGVGIQSAPSGTVMFMSTDTDVFTGDPCMLAAVSMTMSTCSVTVTAGGAAGMHTISGTFTDANAGMAAQIHDTSAGMADYTLQNLALAPFMFTTATQGRAITDQVIPFFGGAGAATCELLDGAMIVIADINGLTVMTDNVGNTCTLTGTPTAAGMFAVIIRVSEGANSDTKMSAITFGDPLVFDTAAGALDAAVKNGPTYLTNIMTSGGQPPSDLTEVAGMALADNAACEGLTLTAGGGGDESVTGVPTGATTGMCMFTLMVMDTDTTSVINGVMGTLSPAATVMQAQTIDVSAMVDLTKPTAANPLLNALAGSAYGGDTFTATGGRVPLIFDITTVNFSCDGTTCTGLTGACTGFTLDQATGAFAHATAPATAGTCTIDARVMDMGNGSQVAATDTETVSFFVLDTLTLIADPANNQVNVINTASDTEVATVDLTPLGASRGPHSIAVRNDGTRALVTLETSDQIAVIDTTTTPPSLLMADSITVSGAPFNCTGPRGIAIGNTGNASNRAYVACTNDSVLILDVSGATPAHLATIAIAGIGGAGEEPMGIDISLDGSLVFLAVGMDDEVYRITTNADPTAETFTVINNGLDNGTADPRHVLVSQDGSVVYHTDVGRQEVQVVNAATPAAATTVNIPVFTGLDPLRMSRDPNTGRVFVTLSTAGTLDPQDAATTMGFMLAIDANASTATKQFTVENNGASRTADVTTLNFTANHTFVIGDIVSVVGVGGGGGEGATTNGIFTVTAVPNADEIEYSQTGEADFAGGDNGTVVLLIPVGTTGPNGVATPADNAKVYAGISSNVARRNDTDPFGSAGADIPLTGATATARQGMASIRNPVP